MTLKNKNIQVITVSGSEDGEDDFLSFSTESEKPTKEELDNLAENLPILPLRNTVLFPGVIIPITVGRDKSIRLIKDVYKGNKMLGVVSQKDSSIENPSPRDINTTGTLAKILKMLRMPDGNTTVIIQGKSRFSLEKLLQDEPYFIGNIKHLTDNIDKEKEKDFKILIKTLKELALQIIQISPNIPSEAAMALENIETSVFLVNFIASNLQIDLNEKQALLEIDDLNLRAEQAFRYLTKEYQKLQLQNHIQDKVRDDIDKQQREYFLTQQLKTIQEELGGVTPDQEVANLRERAAKKEWPKTIGETFNKECDRLQRINPQAPDYSVVLNYLELMLDLPWNHCSKDKFDLKKAAKILDQDHFGLEKVKNRILEYLAVLKLKANMKSPILCLVGPPGVGKTSLGKSIAKALNREYVRLSLGGVRDEATIRGHRKTYIGAMPGRIIQSIKKAGTSNPVFVLDEIDKVGSDFRGDVSSALLEVLDPEQNHSFNDHYLEVDYDLSKVMFIATANSLSNIQGPLLDRMEIIEVNGYTQEEKVEIAKRHLLQKQLTEHGLSNKDLKINSKRLDYIINGYTRESGVRGLDKKIASLVRGIAKNVAMEEPYEAQITEEQINKILGTPRFDSEKQEENDTAGVVTGLAWTSVGGDILYIESSLSRGKGRLQITGNLGDVMKESAQIALAFIKSNAPELGIDEQIFDQVDIHVHVPEGATPKDGPSAGITMLTALVSAFTQKSVRPKIAMTGEITLRGKVLPVGGIQEKILAAKRSGVNTIILSKQNQKDVLEIKEAYITNINFIYVENMKEVLEHALLNNTVKRPIDLKRFTIPLQANLPIHPTNIAQA